MSVAAISNSSLYQLLPSSGQSGAATGAQADPAILPVDDFYSGIPQSISFAMGLYDTTTDMDWKALGDSLTSGDISAAQTALANYNQSLAASNDSMSTLTAPSDQFEGYLAQLGNALDSGDLTKAQSVYGTAQWWAPTSPLFAMGEAIDQAAIDGAKSTNWLQDLGAFAGTLSPAASYTPAASTTNSPDSNLAADLATVQSVIHEEDSNIGDFLLQQGYSQADVNSIVNVLDYKNMTATLGTVTSDIAYITKNTDTFTVTSSISNATTSGNTATAVVQSSTNTFQGDTNSGTSSESGAEATGITATIRAGGETEAFAYSFSIVETKTDGASTAIAATGNSLQSTSDSLAGAMATVSNGEHMLQLVEELGEVTTSQTAADVKKIASTSIVPLGNADPTTSPYYTMMAQSAYATLSRVQGVITDLLGPAAILSANATSSMSGSDGISEAYSSVSVYA